jgi:hypothetical protein
MDLRDGWMDGWMDEHEYERYPEFGTLNAS